MADQRATTARRRTVRIALEVFTIAVALYLIAPRIAGFEKVGRAIARGSLVSILALVVFEAASLLSYGELVRVVLRSMGEPASRGLVQRTTLVGTSLGRTLPGVAAGAPVAAATATVLGWRLFSYFLPILAGLGFLPTLPRRRAPAVEPS